VLLAAHCKYGMQKSRQKSPSGHHRTTSTGYIFASKARIDNRKKNLLSKKRAINTYRMPCRYIDDVGLSCTRTHQEMR